MGKHGNKDNGRYEGKGSDYEPKHAGGDDGFEWSQLPTYETNTAYDKYTAKPSDHRKK